MLGAEVLGLGEVLADVAAVIGDGRHQLLGDRGGHGPWVRLGGTGVTGRRQRVADLLESFVGRPGPAGFLST
ncbi:hypothetical protein GCM10010121_043950 [Streptomyces brasiliensis]|uniref:Uncharacterized protein n=1 Tax=Streptomyces brasiliensis TaxID=1954 RepID=A0A917KSH9_9ACTN|nr:hypothetical protein GCM10010121_043950 [Streptomyces brasiliensis]